MSKKPTLRQAQAYIARCVLADLTNRSEHLWMLQWPEDHSTEEPMHPLMKRAYSQFIASLKKASLRT